MLRVTPETTEQLSYLVSLSLTPDTARWPIEVNVLDFWRDPTRLGGSVDILTNYSSFLEQELFSKGMSPLVLMDDVQR